MRSLLNIIQCANLGGMEQASLRLMQAMRDAGCDFEVLSLHPVGDLGSLLDAEEIPYHGLNYWGPAGMGVIPQLLPILQRHRSETVVMTGPHMAAMLAMKAAGVRGSYLGVHFHHTGVKSSLVWKLVYQLALDRFDWITFPSDFVRDEACQILPKLRERSLTIRYPQTRPADIFTEQRREARCNLGLSEDDFVVGNAGWLIRRKRFDVFLEVAARVIAKFPNAKFLIAGGGEEETSLKALACSLGISDRVIWLGWQKDLTDFWSVIDVLEFNSDWDAFGLTAGEAVARGVPLVASVVNGGLRESLDARLAEHILLKHDVEKLADQVLDIMRSPDVAAEHARESCEHYLRLSDPSVIAAQHLELLVNKP